MPLIPRAPGLDQTPAFLAEGYTFISRRCDRFRSDLFAARIMLTPVVCMRGAEAARIFYDGDRFTRQGAMPRLTLRLLQDKGSVQTLDGEAHRHRKRMFMSLMTPDSVARIGPMLERHWRQALARWQVMPEVMLLHEVNEVLTRTACDWAGVPLAEAEAPAMARELSAMVEHAGGAGPATWWALRLRRRTERRLRDMVEAIRDGRQAVPGGSAAATIAHHTGPDGKPLGSEGAAVELINILRPIVAVGRFITFAALALHEHPDWRPRLAGGEDPEPFAQEVRRHYPFFPVIGGRVRQPFDWAGHYFAAKDWVLLDLYGTNHDPRLWDEPDRFRPERFQNWPGDPYTMIPQGAGDFVAGHRCPGEWITVALVKQALRVLAGGMRYAVPPQDLSINLSRMPAAPRSGFIISQVAAA
jgi:fatty-acid peroxygenase